MATTRGVIKNKQTGAEIKGVLIQDGTAYGPYLFRIDGTAYAIDFLRQEWDFIPEPPKLPTRPGYYTIAPLGATTGSGYRLFYLDHSGSWSEYSIRGDSASSEELKRFLLVYSDVVRPVSMTCAADQPEGMFE